jgi:hypothetical protein
MQFKWKIQYQTDFRSWATGYDELLLPFELGRIMSLQNLLDAGPHLVWNSPSIPEEV